MRHPRAKRSKEERYYVSEEESDLIDRVAAAKGISKSEYVRAVLMPKAAKDAQRLLPVAA